jgi:hypothetical protein
VSLQTRPRENPRRRQAEDGSFLLTTRLPILADPCRSLADLILENPFEIKHFANLANLPI